MSQTVQNVVFGAIYYGSAILTYYIPKLKPETVWTSLFAMMFGAFATGEINAFGPDAEKGKKAAVKIFTITETPSEIDPLAV